MLSILRKARLKDKEMRILMLGLDNAGKTTIVKRIMNEDVYDVSPTLGFNIKTIDFEEYGTRTIPILAVSSLIANLDISSIYVSIEPLKSTSPLWHAADDRAKGDVGGQKSLRTYWKNYFEKTDTLIWVVDATDRERMDDCGTELAGLLLEERLMGASLLVLNNKRDVAGSMDEDEIRRALQLDAIRTHKWKVLSCSAITGVNLQEGLVWVVKDAKERLFLY
ncbi:MAG: hypothetical protein M1831_001066 [Alyxoria varia]|nr:MAG: hypothetical protein M1831_001066 [Alyxoria varia]